MTLYVDLMSKCHTCPDWQIASAIDNKLSICKTCHKAILESIDEPDAEIGLIDGMTRDDINEIVLWLEKMVRSSEKKGA